MDTDAGGRANEGMWGAYAYVGLADALVGQRPADS